MIDDAAENPLSEDPEEAMRLENELTRLRLQAEFGAQFGGDMSKLPPEVEQKFLEHIMQMEQAMHDSEGITVGAILGNPELPEANTMSNDELEQRWTALSALLDQKNINVMFADAVPVAERYRFVRDEVLSLPFFAGMPAEAVFHIPYEEFHPDHAAMIRGLASDWLENILDAPELKDDDSDQESAMSMRDTDDEDEEEQEDVFPGVQQGDENQDPLEQLSSGIVVGDEAIGLDALRGKIEDFQAQFGGVVSFSLDVHKVDFQIVEASTPKGDEPSSSPQMEGVVAGNIAYTVRHADGEEQVVQGPFIVEMRAENGWWGVRYFELPGWVW